MFAPSMLSRLHGGLFAQPLPPAAGAALPSNPSDGLLDFSDPNQSGLIAEVFGDETS